MKTKMSILVMIAGVLVCAMYVAAAPTNPIILEQKVNETWTDDESEKTVTAYGGNVSMLNINDTRQTERWQGYYGNVTGKITLDDASYQTFYDWTYSTISGEVYASNASITDWSTVHCINLSPDYPGNGSAWYNSVHAQAADATTGGESLNITEIETAYGMSTNDIDGVNETFSSTGASIQVGSVTASGCYATNTYSNEAKDTAKWQEVLLTVNNSETIIYAANISDDDTGYDNGEWDFQLMVGEDGTVDGGTTYYFYVELA